MLTRRHALIFAAALMAPVAAHAAGMMQFASSNFAAAKESGAPIVIHVNATWCPTCKAQKPILGKLLAEQKYAAFKAFSVDYDSEKPILKELAAPDRSTIIVFAKGKEVARSVADTSEDKIAALLDKAN